MSGQFILFTQHPEPREVGLGVLSVGRDGEAQFFAGRGERGDSMLAEMVRSRMELAAAKGIMLSGFEPAGLERDGRPKFRHQEWWLAYPEVD